MKCTRIEKQFYEYIVPTLSAVLFISLTILAVKSVRSTLKQFADKGMTDDMITLVSTIE